MTGFYLREKRLSDSKEDEDKLEESKAEQNETAELNKQQLTSLVLKSVKEISSYAEDVEYIDKPLEQAKGRGVIEGGYTIVRFNAKERLFAGTDKLHSCIDVTFYDDEQRLLLTGHFMIRTKIVESFAKFKESLTNKKCHVLKVRLFGGVNTEDYDSNELLQNIIFELYQLSKDFKIIIASVDVIDRIATYRKLKEQQTEKGDFTIGFAVSLANGKVLLQKNIYTNDYHFDAEVTNCGMFSGSAKRAPIYLALHDYWGTPDILNLEYDSDNPNFDKEYEEQYNKLSLTGIAKILLNKLAKVNYCSYAVAYEQTLLTFILDHLKRWLKRYHKSFEQKSATQHLLEYITYSKYSSIFSEEPQPYSESQIKDFFINWLFAKGEIQRWCLKTVCEQIANAVTMLCKKNNVEVKQLITQLNQVNADAHLLDEWINYKIHQYNIAYKTSKSEDHQDYLLYVLKNTIINKQNIAEVLRKWQKTAINNAVIEYILKNVKKIITKDYNKLLHDPYEDLIRDFLFAWLDNKAFDKLLQHLHPKATTYAELEKLNKQIAAIVQTRISRWCPSCNGFLNEDTQNQLTNLLNNWEETVLSNVNLTEIVIVKNDKTKNVGKQEESEEDSEEEKLQIRQGNVMN